ncbi:MAG TPA: branched-chain amino acid ABC transporter permease [Paenalcaligenes sp.]|nr:branched-chain amino acid ABC transporter permease [Paenalcaligenes sp.]HLR82132.1 branched-chain amino acid ABC transporter permease [Paenalcaligenes sp.]
MSASIDEHLAVPLSRQPRPGLLARALPWLVLLGFMLVPVMDQLWGLSYYVGFVSRLLIMMIAASSLNFILGYGGMVALGHASFMGVGAYALVAWVDAGFDSAWIAWGLGVAVAAVLSLLIGLVALRTRGVYFIMITLAFAEMLYYFAVSLSTYGGDDGYSIYFPLTLGQWLDDWNYGFYAVVLCFAALVYMLTSRLEHARFGHALKGARDNESRMQALGYPVFRIRLLAFVGAGAIAGLAGGLLAFQDGFVSPSSMQWTHSAVLIVMVVIGGMGHRWGGALGAAIWLVFEEFLRMHTDYWHWPMGVLLLVIVFLAPRGVAGLFTRVQS